MEEEPVVMPGDEDEPVGPKKGPSPYQWEGDAHLVAFLTSELRSRLGWAVIRAVYDALPEFQDVVRITGLCVDGQAMTGTTYTSYQEPVERLLELEVRGERSSLVGRTALQASLGVARARHRTGEGQAEYLARLTEDARAVLAEEEGEAADRDLHVGNYAWGAALLAHLFDSLGTSSRETSVAGFFPLLQVWAYYHLPSLGRGVARQRGAWTPYVGEDDATQPWVERGRPYFGRDIWLHYFNTVVPLHHRLVARTLRLHQAVVEFPTRQRSWERPGRSFRGIQQEVVSEAASDEDYFRAYARKYGAQVYKGSRRPLDPEGRISSLEGILHSTIQQRDDLQAVVDQLDPGRSILEGQLASAAARAEDALTELREREQELRTALARTTTLEAEMAELRLRPEAAEVARWR
ncbi:hypothetical protein Taro_009494 [Colocasia esculenta]|uniref:Aminotransferase-like plant mobile domain-containing protein n=1 Tax=Colocasia esculenta TaxID=4460 RepID=A0A843U510_COLES|nr:hypothetical protein [Colocasia esculenta]